MEPELTSSFNEKQPENGFFSVLNKYIRKFLLAGITPEKLALCMTLGIFLGIFPLIGTTTLLCALAALALRLNLPAIQAVNYAVYPLQMLLIFPYLLLGSRLFGVELPIGSFEELSATIQSDFSEFWAKFGIAVLYGIVLWLLTSIPLGWICYHILKRIISGILNKTGPLHNE